MPSGRWSWGWLSPNPSDEIVACQVNSKPGFHKVIHRYLRWRDEVTVIKDRMQRLVQDGYGLLESTTTGEAIFTFLRSMVLQWAVTDRGPVEALAGFGIDIAQAAPDAEDAFLALLDELLRAAQKAGTARHDVGVREVKALLVGCQAMQTYNPALAERVTDVVIDGLRVQR